jgi:glutathione S-transferase
VSSEAEPEYSLYYWPSIPGRGEFVRLVLEQAGVAYDDVARRRGPKAIIEILAADEPGIYPLAPPVLVHGDLRIAQTAVICVYLGARHELVANDQDGGAATMQLALTIADLVNEAHDTHHPVGTSSYYEEQKAEALRRAREFVDRRMPKFLRYFEKVLQQGGGEYLIGGELSCVDLAMNQLLRGLEYAFPRAFAHYARELPGLLTLRARVDALPNIAAYRRSDRCLPFSEDGIFRHYPELDLEPIQ